MNHIRKFATAERATSFACLSTYPLRKELSVARIHAAACDDGQFVAILTLKTPVGQIGDEHRARLQGIDVREAVGTNA